MMDYSSVSMIYISQKKNQNINTKIKPIKITQKIKQIYLIAFKDISK